MIKVAFIVPDNRDEFRTYDLPEPLFGPAPAALLKGFSQIEGVEIHVLASAKKPVAAPAKLAPNIHFHSIYTPRFGGFRFLYTASHIGIRRALRAIRPDIVHGQGSERYPALAAATSGFPNVITLHGVASQVAKIRNAPLISFFGITAVLERAALKRAQGVICLSRHSERLVSAYNSRTWCVPNAVDESFFDAMWAPADPPEIPYAAHFYHLKNQIGLIKALDSVAAKHRFVLCLFGKKEEAYFREVQSLAAQRPWIRFEEFKSPAELRETFARAAIVAHPSFEENCPMAILEAMAVGAPIAASNAGGIPDLVEHGKTGLLFDSHNSSSIAEAIDRLLSQPALAGELARAGRVHAETHFRPAAIARRHLEIYREILKK